MAVVPIAVVVVRVGAVVVDSGGSRRPAAAAAASKNSSFSAMLEIYLESCWGIAYDLHSCGGEGSDLPGCELAESRSWCGGVFGPLGKNI